MITRPPLVQMMLDRLKKDADYLDDLPKIYMRPVGERGDAEEALIRYVEALEASTTLP